MEFNLTTPALLFSAISLLLLAFTNRFLALAALVRELHSQYQQSKDSLIRLQIQSLRKRIAIIKYTQLLGAVSFLLCTVSMLILFSPHLVLSEVFFGLALVVLMGSLGLSIWEIYLSVETLNMRLSDMEHETAH
ncbi:MAG: DUF2721 domain-containing protein [Kiritimatiellales bacterium]|jgi:hypothetical protein